MALDRREIAHPTPAVHLLHQTIPDAWHQLRAPLVLPLLELNCSRYLEAVEKLTPNLSLSDIEPARVHLNRARDESDRGTLRDELVAPDLLLQDRQRLGERMIDGRLLDVAVADQVGAAIAEAGDEELRTAPPQGHDDRRAHVL